MNSFNNVKMIPYEELQHMDKEQLKDRLQCTRLVIFGGIGFSGYNEEFNANNGIYRSTLDRADEIEETQKFEEMYKYLTPYLKNKNVIIFTHMPKGDWRKEDDRHCSKFVYVSGHTHRNEFFDDGDYRLYSDNQIGYHNKNPHLKSFLIDYDYDCFDDYKDGIYEIPASQYRDFYRGKNIQMTFTRETSLYMLKKNRYYCFILQGQNGSLSILNGGSLSKLDKKDIKYYFNHMDEVISHIDTPLTKYMSVLRQISKQVKDIGGDGNIHGCIVDIDFYNHIFVNPEDLTITGYWAHDIIKKLVYPDILSLIEKQCPLLYKNYLKLLESDDKTQLTIMKQSNNISARQKEYSDTIMYTASRKVKKMQRLTSNILTVWYDTAVNHYEMLENTDSEDSQADNLLVK
ncbi:MAG: hypothetical protein NC394_03390 [Bacteroides sp.]|nr:hypothetical protein [Bacteroides sp.]